MPGGSAMGGNAMGGSLKPGFVKNHVWGCRWSLQQIFWLLFLHPLSRGVPEICHRQMEGGVCKLTNTDPVS